MGDDTTTRNDDFDPARARKTQAQINLEDHAQEASSEVTPKMRRFIDLDEVPGQISKREKDAQAAARMTRLQLLLLDADYSRAHGRLMATLATAQSEFETALQQSVAAIDRLETLMDDLEDTAARLTDGTLIFRDSVGVLRTADGTIVNNDITRSQLPDPDDATAWAVYPSWEQYDGARRALDNARTQRSHSADVLDDITATRERAQNHDSPMTQKEIEDAEALIQSKLDELRDQQRLQPTFRDQLNTAEGDIADLFPASGPQAKATPQ